MVLLVCYANTGDCYQVTDEHSQTLEALLEFISANLNLRRENLLALKTSGVELQPMENLAMLCNEPQEHKGDAHVYIYDKSRFLPSTLPPSASFKNPKLRGETIEEFRNAFALRADICSYSQGNEYQLGRGIEVANKNLQTSMNFALVSLEKFFESFKKFEEMQKPITSALENHIELCRSRELNPGLQRPGRTRLSDCFDENLVRTWREELSSSLNGLRDEVYGLENKVQEIREDLPRVMQPIDIRFDRGPRVELETVLRSITKIFQSCERSPISPEKLAELKALDSSAFDLAERILHPQLMMIDAVHKKLQFNHSIQVKLSKVVKKKKLVNSALIRAEKKFKEVSFVSKWPAVYSKCEEEIFLRKQFHDQVEDQIEKLNQKLAQIFGTENARRKEFLENYGSSIPSNFVPELKHGVPQVPRLAIPKFDPLPILENYRHNDLDSDFMMVSLCEPEGAAQWKTQLEQTQRDLDASRAELLRARKRVEDLQTELEKSNALLESSELQISELQASQSELQAKFEALASEHSLRIEELKDVVNDKKLQLVQAQREILSLTQDLDVTRQTCENLKLQESTLNQSQMLTANQMQDLQSKLDRINEESLQLHAQIDSLQKELAQRDQRVTALESELTEKSALLEQANIRGNVANEQKANLEAQIQLLQSTLADQQPMLERIPALEASLHDAEAKLLVLEGEKSALAEQLGAHQVSSSDVAGRLATMVAQLQASEASVKTLTSANTDLSNSLAAKDQALAEASERVRVLEASVHAADAQRAAVDAQLAKLQQTHLQTQQQLAQLENAQAAALAQVATLTAQLATTQTALDVANARVPVLEVQIAQLQTQLNSHQANNSNVAQANLGLEARIKMLTEEKQSLEMVVETLTGDIHQANAHISEWKAKLEETNALLAQARAEVLARNQMLEQSKVTYDAVVRELNDTKLQLARVLAELEAARAELARGGAVDQRYTTLMNQFQIVMGENQSKSILIDSISKILDEAAFKWHVTLYSANESCYVKLSKIIKHFADYRKNAVALNSFAIDDVMLFCRNARGFYEAINHGAPNYFLREDAGYMGTQYLMYGRCILLEEFVATPGADPYFVGPGNKYCTVVISQLPA